MERIALQNKKALVKIYFDVNNFITQQVGPETKIKYLYRLTRNKVIFFEEIPSNLPHRI